MHNATTSPTDSQKASTAGRRRAHALVLAAIFFLSILGSFLLSSCGPASSSSSEDEETPVSHEEENSSSSEKPFEETIPEGVPIIDFGDDMEYYDQAMEQIGKAIENLEPEIYVKNLARFDWSHIDVKYFWVSGISDTHYSLKTEDGYQFSEYVRFTYNCKKEDIPAMQKEIDSAAEEILSKVPASADQWETARILHDELCRRVTYDDTLKGTHIRDIYGALVEGSAVCVGYAYALDYLMEQAAGAGSCQTVESLDRTHAWNQLSFQTESGQCTLFIDPTWNDLDKQDANGNEYICHDYFCVTQKELEDIGDEHDLAYTWEQVDEPELFYHVHEGCYQTSYDEKETARIFSAQLQQGNNMLTVRFEKAEDYNRAKKWKDNQYEILNSILTEAGYFGRYLYWENDDMQIINVGLNAPEA